MKNFLTSVKKALAPELCVDNSQLFDGVPRPTYVLAGMIAQQMLHPENTVITNRGDEWTAKCEGKFHITWTVLNLSEDDLKSKFCRYYEELKGHGRYYFNSSDIKHKPAMKLAFEKWLKGQSRTDMPHFNIREPAVNFLDDDRLLIKEACLTVMGLHKERLRVQKMHDDQRAAVKAIEAWMGVQATPAKAEAPFTL